MRRQRACMKNMLCAVSLAASCAIAAEADLSKSWTLSTWGGYEPLAKVEQTDGTIHVSDVRSKYGFGMRSRQTDSGQGRGYREIHRDGSGQGRDVLSASEFRRGRPVDRRGPSSVKQTLPSESAHHYVFRPGGEFREEDHGIRHAHVRRRSGQRTLHQGHEASPSRKANSPATAVSRATGKCSRPFPLT